jgi:hypothetical protein
MFFLRGAEIVDYYRMVKPNKISMPASCIMPKISGSLPFSPIRTIIWKKSQTECDPMTELFKELNIIDILGICVPGCLLVLLLGGDQTAALLWGICRLWCT